MAKISAKKFRSVFNPLGCIFKKSKKSNKNKENITKIRSKTSKIIFNYVSRETILLQK